MDITTSNLCPTYLVKIATVDTYGGRYTQCDTVYIAFSDHLVVKPRKNSLNLASTFGFIIDSDPCDGG